MNCEILNKIVNTLSMIEVKGRKNLALVYQAICLLENGENNDILGAHKCLDQVSVIGKSNIDMLLGCMLTLEEIIKKMQEVKSDGEREERVLDDNGDTGTS